MLTRTSLLLLPLGPALASAGLLSNVEHWLASSERRATPKCGVRGYADTDNNYFWSASKKLASRAACAARCGGDARCESFGYDDRVCMLFDEALAGNFDADRRSDLTFYDAACPNANATATAAAAATTATASASTSSSSGRSRTTRTRTSTTAAAAAMPTVTVPSAVAPSATSLTTSYTRAAASGATGGGAGLISLVANSSSVADATIAAPSAASAQVEPSSASASVVESAVAVVPVTNAVLNNNGTSPSSSSSSSSNATIPDGCDIPASFTVTSLVWFDSADNLDCVHPNYANGSQVCWDAAQPQQLCDPTTTPDAATTCTCAPYCWPGTPAVARQPLGYGPPDTVSITLGGAAVGLAGGNGTCRQSNPPDAGTTQALLPEEVGDGSVDCGGATLDVLRFYGSSSSLSSSGNGTAATAMGRIEFSPPEVECGGRAAEYGASFALACETDAGGNATCTASMPLTLSLTGFSS